MNKKVYMIIGLVVIILMGIFGFLISKPNNTTSVSSLERITQKGTLVLGLDDSFPPMGYRNENNEIVGFDIDVAKKVCEKIGVELILQPISWDAKEQELNSYNIDCIWNGMSVTDERKQAMCLSDAYMQNSMVFVVKNKAYKTKDDLKGKNIGVQGGSSAEEILKGSEINNSLKEVISYKENITAFMDLEIGGVDAVFVDSVVANYYIASNNKEYKVIDEALANEEYAIGFRKVDTELCQKVNEALKQIKQDGTLEEISNKWFGKDVTIIK